MNQNKNGLPRVRSRGFTLIELLVVIAIIGILSSIVLAALQSSRNTAQDSKVKSQLASVRNDAEVYLSSNGDTYNNTGSDINDAPATGAACTLGMFADVDSGLANLTGSASAWPGNTALVCNASADGSQYAVSASLSSPTEFWCVDNTNVSRAEIAALGNADFACL